MKLILKSEVDRLGVPGDKVTVKDGYGRNFLLPQGLAMLDTPGNRNTLEHIYLRSWKIKGDKLRKAAQKAVDEWGMVAVTIAMRIGEDGKMFGAVTSSDIADAVKAQRGIEVDRRKLSLEEPIKSIGEHVVPLKLHAEVSANIHVHVSAIVERKIEDEVHEETLEEEIPEDFKD